MIDHQTRRNLEITQTARDGTYNGSLLWALDRTVTAMGGRTLRRWLLQPLLDVKGIKARQSTIHELLKDGKPAADAAAKAEANLRPGAAGGSGRFRYRQCPRPGGHGGFLFLRLPDLAALTEQATSPYLTALQYVPPELEQLGQTLRSHLVENPPPLPHGRSPDPRRRQCPAGRPAPANFRRPAVDCQAGVCGAAAHRHQTP